MKQTQMSSIREYLENGNSITSMQAFQMFGCRLRRRTASLPSLRRKKKYRKSASVNHGAIKSFPDVTTLLGSCSLASGRHSDNRIPSVCGAEPSEAEWLEIS